MGLEETEDGKCGWYNGTNVRLLTEAGGDSDAAADAGMVIVRKRLSYLAAHPMALLRFYGRKLLTQWADPTKVSLREQELTGRHLEGIQPAIGRSLTFGRGLLIMQGVMHMFHLILCATAAIGLMGAIRRHRDERLWIIVVFITGGLLFHIIWEASGRYILRYELALLPYAAGGCSRIFGRLEHGLGKRSDNAKRRAWR